MFSASIDEGLELKLLEPRYAEALFRLTDNNRERLNEWFPWVEGTKTVEDSEAFIRGGLESYAKGKVINVGIWMSGELAGTVGSGPLSEEFRSTEMGYWLGAAYEGRGIMTKTCAYLITYFFEELNLNRIEIRLSESNTRSRAIPERLGFKLEGNLRKMSHTRDGLTNCLIYSLLADGWQKKTQEDREHV